MRTQLSARTAAADWSSQSLHTIRDCCMEMARVKCGMQLQHFLAAHALLSVLGQRCSKCRRGLLRMAHSAQLTVALQLVAIGCCRYSSKLNKSLTYPAASHADATIAKACSTTHALSDLLLSPDAAVRIADVRSALAGDARAFRSVITCAELKARELAHVDFERPHPMPTRIACAILQEAVSSTAALRASLLPILDEVFRAMFENYDACADSDRFKGKCLDNALPYHHIALKLRTLCSAQEAELQGCGADRTHAVEALRVAEQELQLLRQRLKVSDAAALLHAKRTMQHWLALMLSKCFGSWLKFVRRCKTIVRTALTCLLHACDTTISVSPADATYSFGSEDNSQCDRSYSLDSTHSSTKSTGSHLYEVRPQVT